MTEPKNITRSDKERLLNAIGDIGVLAEVAIQKSGLGAEEHAIIVAIEAYCLHTMKEHEK